MTDKRDLELLSLDGWVRRYWEMIPDYGTMELTYEAIERQYERAFGKRKYSSLQSFKTCFYRYVEGQRK